MAFKASYLPMLAVAGQAAGVFLLEPTGFGDPLRRLLIMAGYVVALAFVWRNRSRLGLLIVGLGLVLNLAVMSANGGLMPVAADRAEQAGLSQRIAGVATGEAVPGTKNVLLEPGSARLEILSDVLVVPGGALIRQRVVSLGDLLVVLGVLTLATAAVTRGITARMHRTPGLGPPLSH